MSRAPQQLCVQTAGTLADLTPALSQPFPFLVQFGWVPGPASPVVLPVPWSSSCYRLDLVPTQVL